MSSFRRGPIGSKVPLQIGYVARAVRLKELFGRAGRELLCDHAGLRSGARFRLQNEHFIERDFPI
jgi:hypothetical protein